MELIYVWNIIHNSNPVLIRSNGHEIFGGLMGDVPIKFMGFQVIWIKSVDDVLIIDVRVDN